MKVLGSDAYREVRNWMYRNARPLELALWRRKFEGGGASAVIEALSAYCNEDGGYGRALEPDLWTPESSPYTTLKAGQIALSAGIRDPAHPILRGICAYLMSGAHFNNDVWSFTIPSGSEYPHAPWWTYSPDNNESIGLTAEIAAFLLRVAPEDSEAFHIGKRIALKSVEAVVRGGETEMGVSGLVLIWTALEERNAWDTTNLARLRENCVSRVNASIERDTSKWGSHCPKPSRYIDSQESPFYPGNEEIVRSEIEYLIDTRERDGVWGLDWNWFDLAGVYPREWAIAENWWRAWAAIDTISFLSRFGRLE